MITQLETAMHHLKVMTGSAIALPIVGALDTEGWIALLAKAGLQGVLCVAVVAEAGALIWMTKRAMGKNERTDALADKTATALQANSDSQKDLADAVRQDSQTTAELAIQVRQFATVIEKCNK